MYANITKKKNRQKRFTNSKLENRLYKENATLLMRDISYILTGENRKAKIEESTRATYCGCKAPYPQWFT